MMMVVLVIGMAACTPKNANQETATTQEPTALDNIFARKSVRQYTSEPITAEQLEMLVKAAMAAPSGRNLQPWHFVVVTDQAIKDSMVTNNHNKMISEAAAVVVVCAETMTKMKASPDATEEVLMENQLWRDDCAAATENLLLAAEAMGLGAVWTACYPFEERMNPVRAAVGLPENITPYAVVPIGHPAGNDQPKDKWKPEKVHYDRW